jgi:hypothetical protein
MAGGEPEHEPPVGRHEEVAVDVATELLHRRVLPSLVSSSTFHSGKPRSPWATSLPHRSCTGTWTTGSGRSLVVTQ